MHRDEDQSRCGVGEARAEWDVVHRHPERQDDRGHEGDLVSVQPDLVHGDLASTLFPPVSHGVTAAVLPSVTVGNGRPPGRCLPGGEGSAQPVDRTDRLLACCAHGRVTR